MTSAGFLDRLNSLMVERQINRAQLARMTDIPYHRLNPWFIRANAKPSSADLLRVARLFDVTEEYLLSGGQRRPFGAERRTPEEAEIARLVRLLPDHLRRQLLGYATALADGQDQSHSEDREGGK